MARVSTQFGKQYVLSGSTPLRSGTLDHPGRRLDTTSKRIGGRRLDASAMRRAREPRISPRSNAAHLVVLNVQPRARPAQTCHEPGGGRAHQTRRDAHHDIGAPRELRGEHRQRRQRIARQMQQTRDAGGPRRHPQRHPLHRHAAAYLAAIAPRAEALGNAPLRVIRRPADNPHFMTFADQRFRHLSGIFTDSSELRRVVEPNDQNFHTPPHSAHRAARAGARASIGPVASSSN